MDDRQRAARLYCGRRHQARVSGGWAGWGQSLSVSFSPSQSVSIRLSPSQSVSVCLSACPSLSPPPVLCSSHVSPQSDVVQRLSLSLSVSPVLCFSHVSAQSDVVQRLSLSLSVSPVLCSSHISPLSDLVKTLTISGCSADSEHISRLEHVQLHLKLSTGRRGTISITLTSPFNMRTQILKERPNDRSSEGIDFTFMTVHNWGEAPHGEWTLTVHNGDEAHTAVLHAWSLTLYGTAGATNPNRALGLDIAATLGHGAVERGTAGPSHLRAADLRQLMHAEREISSSLDTMSPGEALGTSKRTNDVGRDEAKPQLLNLLSHMLAADQGKLRKRGYVEGAQAEGTQHHAHKTSSALSLLKRLLLAIKRERMRA